MITSYEELLKFCPNINPKIKKVIDKYGILVTEHYLSLIDLKNPKDPLFKAVIPSISELKINKWELSDPIGDNSSEFKTQKTKMLIHRYPDRVLLLTTNKCAGNCRYCFRKEKVFNNEETIFNTKELEKSLNYIQKTKQLKEVILSGGDPLYMPRQNLYRTLNFIKEKCKHIKTVRIHTRAPIYNPDIITDEISEFLNNFNKKIPLTIITHIIHPKEICDKFITSINKIKCIKLNQNPILKGINDSTECLINLSYELLKAGILPHYLHILDKAKGISHFKVSIKKAQDIVYKMQQQISGHLVPKLILDQPNGYGKVWLNKSFIQKSKIVNGKYEMKIKSTHSNKIALYKED